VASVIVGQCYIHMWEKRIVLIVGVSSTWVRWRGEPLFEALILDDPGKTYDPGDVMTLNELQPYVEVRFSL